VTLWVEISGSEEGERKGEEEGMNKVEVHYTHVKNRIMEPVNIIFGGEWVEKQ
jgi:hypothetical protein